MSAGRRSTVRHSAARCMTDVSGGSAAASPRCRGRSNLVRALHGSRPLGVASNGSPRRLQRRLAAAGFPRAFDAIVALDGSTRPKPAPDLYIEACARLERRPGRGIAFEDSPRGAQAARTAGLRVVGIGHRRRPSRGLAELVVPTWPTRACTTCSARDRPPEPGPAPPAGRSARGSLPRCVLYIV